MAKILRILGKHGKITIPYAIRMRIGFAPNDVLSFSESADGTAVIIRRELLCSAAVPSEKEAALAECLSFDDLASGLTRSQRFELLQIVNAFRKDQQGCCHGR